MDSQSARPAADFVARLRARLEELSQAAASGEITDIRANLRKAAALLSVFEPSQLRIPEQGSVPGAELHLVADATSVSGRGAVRWKLRSEVRTAALRSFRDADEAMAYLEANIDQAAARSTARFALDYLRHEPPNLRGLDSEDLARVRKAVRWLRNVDGTDVLPDLDEVEQLLDRSRLFDPLRFLVSLPFAGRKRELAVLEDHFGLAPTTLRGKVSRAGRALRAAEPTVEQPGYPLVVHGPGGIGKSTLLARCLIDHLTGPHAKSFPFIYVDSERATISLDEPMTLVAEMARQLAVQYPDAAGRFTDLSDQARDLAREQHDLEQDVEALREVPTAGVIRRNRRSELHATARGLDRRMMLRLGGVLRDVAGDGTPPFVVVLDSFEEAQYRGSPVLDRMWVMLTALHQAYPRTRVAVAGRAPIGHPAYSAEQMPTIELGELDPPSALRFLRDRDVPEPLAREIIKRVGRSPLSLRLAAKVAAVDVDDRWLAGVPSKHRRFWTDVDDMLIRGILYDRILSHIKDPDVRMLAYPGLALRWITPELIRFVLAPSTGVAVDADEAERLFDAFAAELDLVETAPSGELVHRPDVRKVMLRLLAADWERLLREVEQRAIDFHAASDDPRDRAEELYHRLRLGGQQAEIQARWTVEAAARLKDSHNELPVRSAQLLSRLLDATEGVELLEDGVQVERVAVEEAENLITQGFPAEALKAIATVPDPPPCSALRVLRAEALTRMADYAGATAAVEDALGTDGVSECGDTYLELLQLSAMLAARRGDLDAADDDLAVAERVARRLDRELDAVSVLLQRARLLDGARSREVTDALVSRVRTVSDELLASQPTLAWAVAAAVGAAFPDVLDTVLRLVGMPRLSDKAVVVLAKAIVRAIGDGAVAATLARTAADDLNKWRHASVADVADLITASGRTGRLDEMARHLLVVDGEDRTLREGIIAAMDEGTSDA
ncbi:AAA family ATPase [Amycolatopsis sp. A133]|uniref:AAA family ATPase n=1 Tax=Amycolatopsis sp. A133 TaxID=3064472 RepID=UPI0027F5C981|nr:AAA family ATPase [Amycolatopsis sp. A133]MDQ7802717.1 AAA family ATPase [Amycolatopsis sp. A133]